MSKKRDWKGSKQTPRTPEQHRKEQEYEAMSEEEKREIHRDRFVDWLKMFMGTKPIMHINGKEQEHSPMSPEEAALHLALYDGEVEPTPGVKLQLAQFEVLRWPKNKKLQAKLWKALEESKK